jgi:hypothetical protein
VPGRSVACGPAARAAGADPRACSALSDAEVVDMPNAAHLRSRLVLRTPPDVPRLGVVWRASAAWPAAAAPCAAATRPDASPASADAQAGSACRALRSAGESSAARFAVARAAAPAVLRRELARQRAQGRPQRLRREPVRRRAVAAPRCVAAPGQVASLRVQGAAEQRPAVVAAEPRAAPLQR